MDKKKKSVFRQESLDRIESPEKLDQYIKVSKPSTWILITALIVIVVAASIWAFVGSLPVTVTAKGVSQKNDQVICFLDPAEYSSDLTGSRVEITLPDHSTVEGNVVSVSEVPFSIDDVLEELGREWIVAEVLDGYYAYQLDIKTDKDLPADTIVTAVITTQEVRPIEYLLN